MGTENGQKNLTVQAQDSETAFLSDLTREKKKWVKLYKGKYKPSKIIYAQFYEDIQKLARSLKKIDLALAIVRSLAKENDEFGQQEGVMVGAGATAALSMASIAFILGNNAFAIVILILCAIGALLLLFTPIISGSKRAKTAAFYKFAEDAIENMDKGGV